MNVGTFIETCRVQAAAVQRFQDYLNSLPTPRAQKTAITDAFAQGLIKGYDAELLIQVYQLETA